MGVKHIYRSMIVNNKLCEYKELKKMRMGGTLPELLNSRGTRWVGHAKRAVSPAPVPYPPAGLTGEDKAATLEARHARSPGCSKIPSMRNTPDSFEGFSPSAYTAIAY